MSDIYRIFYEAVGAHYPEDEITYATISGVLRKKWIERTLRSFPPGILLDCGCNVGRLSSGWKGGAVFGIDISHAVLQRGKKYFPNTSFIHGDLRSLTFMRDNSIDNAMVCEVLEHLDAPFEFLKNLKRIMKPDGRALITVPGYTGRPVQYVPLGIMRSYGVTSGTHGTEYLHHAYKPHELEHLVSRAGFRVLASGSFEIELRLWQKPLTMLESLFYAASTRLFPQSRLNWLFQRTLDRLKINIFFILDVFGLSALLHRIFSEGRRSYVIITS
jgi:SAM-dependent methyltransferase